MYARCCSWVTAQLASSINLTAAAEVDGPTVAGGNDATILIMANLAGY
jgi:hypothetical protein